MDFEFDKEMDALLRQTRRGETVSAVSNPKSAIQNPKSAHVDADEISLFAENVLPAESRTRVTEHLANCNRCRKIFAEFVLLGETESENLHHAEVKPVIAVVPWYKKLFAFPQIAYTMGALALIFSGVIALLILQNARETQNASVAQMEKTPEISQSSGGGPRVDDAAISGENSALSNSAAASNTTSVYTNSNAASVSSNAAVSNTTAKSVNATNSNVLETNKEKQILTEAETKSAPKPPVAGAAPENKSTTSASSEVASAAADAPAPAKKENNYQINGAQSDNEAIRRQTDTAQNQAVQNQQNISPGTLNARRAPAQAMRAQNERDRNVSTAADETSADAKKSKSAAPSRTAGGKVFKFADGAWYDAAYKNQRATNVRRGTTEYKNLDAGLRSIADNIGGTVVVVWKGNAYRIQ